MCVLSSLVLHTGPLCESGRQEIVDLNPQLPVVDLQSPSCHPFQGFQHLAQLPQPTGQTGNSTGSFPQRGAKGSQAPSPASTSSAPYSHGPSAHTPLISLASSHNPGTHSQALPQFRTGAPSSFSQFPCVTGLEQLAGHPQPSPHAHLLCLCCSTAPQSPSSSTRLDARGHSAHGASAPCLAVLASLWDSHLSPKGNSCLSQVMSTAWKPHKVCL